MNARDAIRPTSFIRAWGQQYISIDGVKLANIYYIEFIELIINIMKTIDLEMCSYVTLKIASWLIKGLL